MEIPTYVDTELGRASVGVCRPERATKIYTCPFCETSVGIGEEHAVVTPDVKFELRRHIHYDCLNSAIEHLGYIKLHNSNFDVVEHYFR